MKRACFASASVVFAVVLLAKSTSAEPNHIHDRWIESSTRVDESLCSFPIVVSGAANINDLIFFGDDGRPVRLLSTVNQVEITYSANGKTLTAKGSGGIEYTVNPDRTITVQTFGIDLLLIIPGYGPVFLDAGRGEFLLDKMGLHEIFASGPALYDMPAFCGALS